MSAEPRGPLTFDPQAAAAISVVICAYTEKRWAELADAIRSVREQRAAASDLVVVVDHNDELLGRLQGAYPDVRVVGNDRRPGLAGARNAGAAAGAGDVIAYLDDDAVADPDWVEQLQRAFRDPTVLGVGGSISPAWSTGRPPWFPEEFLWVVGSTYRGIPTVAGRIRNPIGANMSVRRAVFDAVGGFREEMGRLEETDFCIRVQEQFPDRIWYYWPPAHVRHVVTPERETWAFFVRRCHNEGLAKATMVRMTSRQAGLESERRYVRVTLPTGMLRGLRDAVGGDPSGLVRAAAIAAGLAATLVGYARGLVRLRRAGGAEPVIPRRGFTP